MGNRAVIQMVGQDVGMYLHHNGGLDTVQPLLDVAKELGVDHKYVLNRLKCLEDNSEDDNIILQSTKELGKIIGTSVNTVKQRDVGVFGVFQGFSPDQLESAKQEVLPEKSDG